MTDLIEQSKTLSETDREGAIALFWAAVTVHSEESRKANPGGHLHPTRTLADHVSQRIRMNATCNWGQRVNTVY